MERDEIFAALRDCNWVMARAARKLGITVRMIRYKIEKYGIRTKEVRWNRGRSAYETEKDSSALTGSGEIPTMEDKK